MSMGVCMRSIGRPCHFTHFMFLCADTAVCIWDRELVDSFQQPAMVREPDDLMENFEPLGSVPTVGRVLEDMHRSDDADLMLRGHLLTGFSDSKTGLYSMFHENTIWKYGYDHSNTIRNAFMSVKLPLSACSLC